VVDVLQKIGGVTMDPEEEERIRKRQAGHPVTVEVFMAWKLKFEEELRAIRMAQEGASYVEKDDRVSEKDMLCDV
jgi:hypothetical protein